MHGRIGIGPSAMVAAVAALAVSGCGGGSSGGNGIAAGAGGGATHRLAESADGSTVRAHVGDVIEVTLHSTYWQLGAPSGPVLAAEAAPSASPGGPSCPTIPGSGCGTVVAVYRVASAGDERLQAHRSSCGEALRCTGSAGRWSVSVQATR